MTTHPVSHVTPSPPAADGRQKIRACIARREGRTNNSASRLGDRRGVSHVRRPISDHRLFFFLKGILPRLRYPIDSSGMCRGDEWERRVESECNMKAKNLRKSLKSVAVGMMLGALALSGLMSTGCDPFDAVTPSIVPAGDQAPDKLEQLE